MGRLSRPRIDGSRFRRVAVGWILRRIQPGASQQGEPTVLHSQDRILTTHVGSLPRPPDLLAMLEAREQGRPVDEAAFAARVAAAVQEVVARQVAVGLDSVCDGEQSKISYTFYVRHRLAG